MKTVFNQQQDKVNYLKGLIRLAKCNGVVDSREQEYYSLAAKGMGLNDNEIAFLNQLWDSEEKISLVFTNKYDAVFFLQEGVQLCAIDGTFDDIEKMELKLIAEEVGICVEDYRRIEKWVLEGLAWRKKGEMLVEEIAERK